LAVEYFVDKPSGSKEQNLSNKQDIVNAFFVLKKSWSASKLKADLKFSEVEASFVDIPGMQEDQILHDAAKVLRGSLHAVEISKDFYPSPSDLSHHKSLQFVRLLL
jgi:hypothetical protein